MAGRAWARPAFGRQTPKGLVSIRSFLLLLLLPPPPPPSCCPALLLFYPFPSPLFVCLSISFKHLFAFWFLFPLWVFQAFPLSSTCPSSCSDAPKCVPLCFLPFHFSPFPPSLWFKMKLEQFFSLGSFLYFYGISQYNQHIQIQDIFFLFFYRHPKTWLCFWTPHSVIFVQSPTLTHILQVHSELGVSIRWRPLQHNEYKSTRTTRI